MKVIARPTFEELIASLDRQHAASCAASAGLLETIAYLDETQSWGDDETSLECFLAARYAVASRTAWGWVRVARALRTLPAIREAYGAGQLSWDQLRPLIRFATVGTDEMLARQAASMRVGQLWREARRHERTRRQREMKKDAQLRSLRMEWDEDGRFLHMEGDLPAEEGAAVQATLEARAAEVVLEQEDPPFDRHGAKLADALVEMLSSSAGDASPATLVVHADAALLLGTPSGDSKAETESGAQLPNESVRRLACDARIEWVLEAHGRAVGIGRRGRVIPGWLGRQLRHRDPECRFDGCDRTKSLISHHVVHWARGGPTDLDNLVRLCRTHHRLVHEAGWRITGHPDRSLRFHDPGVQKRTSKSRSSLGLVAAGLR